MKRQAHSNLFKVRQFVSEHLQLILQMNNCVNSGLWMLSILEKRLENISQAESSNLRKKIAVKNEVAVFTRLLNILPSSFLFAHAQNADECVWQQASKKVEDANLSFFSFVHTYLRTHLFEMCFDDDILPHLFCGLMQRASTDSLINLFSSIPLMIASLLVQWKDIPDVQWLCRSRYPDLYDVISVWREKIEGNFESETLKRSFDMPLYSVCVAIIVLRRNADVQAIIEMLKHLSSYFSKLFLAFAHCLISFVGQIMENDVTCEMVWFSKLLDSVLEEVESSEFCNSLCRRNLKLLEMFSDSVCETYFSLSLLRLLSRSESISLLHPEKMFLSIMLSCYRTSLQMNECYDNKVQALIMRSISNARVETLKVEMQKYELNDVIRELLKAELRRRNY